MSADGDWKAAERGRRGLDEAHAINLAALRGEIGPVIHWPDGRVSGEAIVVRNGRRGGQG
jgi:hypothetical protein